MRYPRIIALATSTILSLTVLGGIGCNNASQTRRLHPTSPMKRTANAVQPQENSRTSQPSKTLIGMQYEPWFTPEVRTWDTAEAIPILGKYSSQNPSILKQHAEWFQQLGINWILVDWSNMLWMKPEWEKQTGQTLQLEKNTELLFSTYSKLQQDGQHPPKIVLLLGLQNGPPVKHGVARLRKIFTWVDAHFLDNPKYKNLLLYYHGKPLVTILYNPANPCSDIHRVLSKHPLDEPEWTVRWMASQLQVNHAESCGFWSWMDGTIRQVVTYRHHRPEVVVVTPASFGPGGWLAATATGRDHGAPYLESWKVAFKARPQFIQIHQWNEFAGQPKGHGYGPRHDVYVDEYSPEFSDDIEPTQLDKCGYRVI